MGVSRRRGPRRPLPRLRRAPNRPTPPCRVAPLFWKQGKDVMQEFSKREGPFCEAIDSNE
jgi:hypothetical protein